MASVVTICNLALSHVSAYRIDSIDESSKEARECKKLFESIRNAVLEAHDWGFARKRGTLAAVSGESVDGWDYVYAWPADCICPRKIYDSAESADGIDFEDAASENLDGRRILTDQLAAILIYTAKVTNANLFSPLFIDAFGYRMAGDLAQPLRGNMNLQNQMMQIYFEFMDKARMVNANSGRKKQSDSSSFLRARS